MLLAVPLAVPLPLQAVKRAVLCLPEEAVCTGVVARVVDSAGGIAVAIVDAASRSPCATNRRSDASAPARWLRSRCGGVEAAAQADNDPRNAWGWSSAAP